MTTTREPYQRVTITCEGCANTYGVAPCTASVGITGQDKCFNTLVTCQDRPNYIATDVDYVFSTQNENLLGGAGPEAGIPSLINVASLPTTLNVASTSASQSPLGRRASVRITLNDHPHHDRPFDPYWRERDYDPMERSTFWRKWVRRNPFYNGFPLKVETFDFQENLPSKIRYYVLDKIDVASKGSVGITAKDVLISLNDVMYPAATTGQLTADIDAAVTSFVIDDVTDYPASGVIIIQKEIMTYTRVGATFTIARAQFGSVAASHNQGDTVQLCSRVQGRVDVILYFLLLLGKVPASMIDYAGQWQPEADKWLGAYVVDRLLTKPEKIGTMIGELLEECSCVIWFDERNGLVPLKAIRPLDPSLDSSVELNGTEHLIDDATDRKDFPEQRFDQIWIHYGIRNYAESLTDTTNYAKTRVINDYQAQRDFRTEESPKAKQIFSKWLDEGATGIVVTTGTRILQRISYTPVQLTFALDAKDGGGVWTGDVVKITSRYIIDDYGAELPTLMQVISSEETEEMHRVNYVSTFFGLQQRTSYITPNDWPTYDAATDEQRLTGFFIAGNDGVMPNGDPPYLLV